MSLFLFRKILPPEEPSLDDFVANAIKPSEVPPQEFLDFAGNLVDKMFPQGWDVRYRDIVEMSSLNTSSCEEGGSTRQRYLDQYDNDESRDAYMGKCLGREPLEGSNTARMKRVFTAGKYRLISIPCMEHHHLRPLHNVFYDHLSKQGWLLRGDATSDRFFLTRSGKPLRRQFLRSDDEIFVSGDYESATDNLNNHVQKFLLDRVLSHCTHVPDSIKEFALDSLNPVISWSKGEFRLARGQMMGFLLSFPLLCLVNYVTFRYFVRRPVPVKINGDDIVFRASREEYERWSNGVSSCGLTLSRGKTMISSRYFTLNSTLFHSGSERITDVPFIRPKALFGVEDSTSSPVTSLVGRSKSFCPGFHGPCRDYWLAIFLKHNKGFIKKSGRSLNRGLGISVSEKVLRLANLWDRECAYLSLPKERPPPPSYSIWSHVPDGYELSLFHEKQVLTKEEKKELSSAFVLAAWKPPKPISDWEDEHRDLTLKYCELPIAKWARLHKMKIDDLRNIFANRRREIFDNYLNTRVRRYWGWKKIASPASRALEAPLKKGGEEIEPEEEYKFISPNEPLPSSLPRLYSFVPPPPCLIPDKLVKVCPNTIPGNTVLCRHCGEDCNGCRKLAVSLKVRFVSATSNFSNPGCSDRDPRCPPVDKS